MTSESNQALTEIGHEETIHRRTDHRLPARGGSRHARCTVVPQVRLLGSPLLPLWRNKFGGMNVSGAKRLRELETENARLKKLLAETMLENAIAKEALRKKW